MEAQLRPGQDRLAGRLLVWTRKNAVMLIALAAAAVTSIVIPTGRIWAISTIRHWPVCSACWQWSVR